MGADDLWYSTMRKPSLASSPFDWKLMLLWPKLNLMTKLSRLT